MPGKNLEGIVGAQLGRSQSDFIEARMKGLRTFLDRVLDSPYLKDDVSVTDFLSQQSDSGWSSAKKKQAPERPVPSDSTRNGDTGIAKWLDKIGNLKVPDGPSLKVQNMEKHVSVLKGLYTELNQHLSKSVHNTESVDGKISKLVEAFEKVIVNLKIDEERFSKFENGDAEVDEVSSKIITRTEEVMKAWSSCVRENKDQLAEFVKRPMDDLCLQIESVHDMLKSHQLAVNRYTVAWKSKDHYDFEMKKAEDTGRADKLASLKAKQTAAMDNLTNMRAQMDHESTSVRVCVCVCFQITSQQQHNHNNNNNNIRYFVRNYHVLDCGVWNLNALRLHSMPRHKLQVPRRRKKYGQIFLNRTVQIRRRCRLWVKRSWQVRSTVPMLNPCFPRTKDSKVLSHLHLVSRHRRHPTYRQKMTIRKMMRANLKVLHDHLARVETRETPQRRRLLLQHP